MNGITYTGNGTYRDSLIAKGGCDSLHTVSYATLQLKTTPKSNTICAGKTFVFGGKTLKISGVYNDTIRCDSIVILTLTILPKIETTINKEICQGDSVAIGTKKYNKTGSFTDILKAKNGCDSTVVLDLKIRKSDTLYKKEIRCFGEKFTYDGITYDKTGKYITSKKDNINCNQYTLIDLIIRDSFNKTIDVKICAGANFHGHTTNGTYVEAAKSINGCDSTLTIKLEVVDKITRNETYCAGKVITIGTATYTSGTNMITLLGKAGACDTILTLTILNPIPVTTIKQTICANDTFWIKGIPYVKESIYTQKLISINGCDSIISLDLKVRKSNPITITKVICFGETFTYDKIYDKTGIYTVVQKDSFGCKQIATINLTIRKEVEDTITKQICKGKDYLGYTTSGTYTKILNTVNGCDSILKIALTVVDTIKKQETYCDGKTVMGFNSGTHTVVIKGVGNDCDTLFTFTIFPAIPITNLDKQICTKDTFWLQGKAYFKTGTFNSSITNANGCEEKTILNLTVFPKQDITKVIHLCDGEKYIFQNQTFTKTEKKDFVLKAANTNECDSTLHLSVIVHPKKVENITKTLCFGGKETFFGEEKTKSGIFTNVIKNSLGCDSIVTILNLTVNSLFSKKDKKQFCTNQSFVFDGKKYNKSDSLTAHYSYKGCDSTYTLILDFKDVLTSNVTKILCKGEQITIGNKIIITDFKDKFQLKSSSGCDSIVSYDIQFLDKISLELNAPKAICTPQNVTLKIVGAANLSNVTIKNETTGEEKNYAKTTSIIVSIDKTTVFSITNATIAGFNCSIDLPKTSTTIILNPAKIELDITKKITCFDSKNGVITTKNPQGNEPFSYQWNTGVTANSLKDLDTGKYSVTMTDNYGCTASATTILTAPTPISAAVKYQLPCQGQSEGSITLHEITGGTGSYTWSFNNDAMPVSPLPYTFDKLKSGNYLLNIFDSNGCAFEKNININSTSPTKLTLQADSTVILPSSEVELHTLINGVKGDIQNIKSFTWSYGKNMRFEVDSLAPMVHVLDSIKNNFKLKIIDKNGCVASASITISSNGKHHVGWPNVVIYPNELFTLIGSTVNSMFQFSKNRTFLKNLKNNILIYNKISIFYFYKNYKKIIKF